MIIKSGYIYMAHSKQVPLNYCLHFAMVLILVMMVWLKVNDKQVTLPFDPFNSEQASTNNASPSAWDDRLADSSY